jgi:hypothetical protein
VAKIDPNVRSVLDGVPRPVRNRLFELRDLILETAQATDGVGEITETLKWGEPAYLPAKPRVGTTIRINALKGSASEYGLFVHCQTNLIDTYRSLFSNELRFSGDRAIIFDARDDLPAGPLRHCIALALTYHLDRRGGRRR